jgi:hypothetical protein
VGWLLFWHTPILWRILLLIAALPLCAIALTNRHYTLAIILFLLLIAMPITGSLVQWSLSTERSSSLLLVGCVLLLCGIVGSICLKRATSLSGTGEITHDADHTGQDAGMPHAAEVTDSFSGNRTLKGDFYGPRFSAGLDNETTTSGSLPRQDELPAWFTYPPEYRWMIEHGVVIFPPWDFMPHSRMLNLMKLYSRLFRKDTFVPFSEQYAQPIVAFWERDHPGEVFNYYWEDYREYPRCSDATSFWEWFRTAADDMLEWAEIEADYGEWDISETRLELPKPDDLPGWFTYPPLFRWFIDHGIAITPPWTFLPHERVLELTAHFAERFGEAKLIPFAERNDRGIIACWERENPDQIFYCAETDDRYPEACEHQNLQHWFRAAINDLIDHAETNIPRE